VLAYYRDSPFNVEVYHTRNAKLGGKDVQHLSISIDGATDAGMDSETTPGI